MLAPSRTIPTPAIHLGKPIDDFVEIELLLPKNRAVALLQLARDRRETVGQILRKLVDHALTQELSA